MDTNKQKVNEPVKDVMTIIRSIMAGLVAAFSGAIIYALVPFILGIQFGWIAVGIGLLVGVTVNKFGKDKSHISGIIGATFAIFGCVVGDILSVLAIYSFQNEVSFFNLIRQINPVVAFDILLQTSDLLNFLFYAMAALVAYPMAYHTVKLPKSEST